MNGADLLDLARMQRVCKRGKFIPRDLSEQSLSQVQMPHRIDHRLHEVSHQRFENRISIDQSRHIQLVRTVISHPRRKTRYVILMRPPPCIARLAINFKEGKSWTL